MRHVLTYECDTSHINEVRLISIKYVYMRYMRSVHINSHKHTNTHKHSQTYTRTHACARCLSLRHTCTRIQLMNCCMHELHLYIYTYAQILACTRAFTYPQTHIHTHARTHTHTHTRTLSLSYACTHIRNLSQVVSYG